MQQTFRQFDLGDVTLRPGEFRRRFDLNRGYVMSLETRHLLQNFYIEAGLWAPRDDPGDIHWGWERPPARSAASSWATGCRLRPALSRHRRP